MNRTVARAGWVLFHTFIAAYALFLCLGAITLHGQTKPKEPDGPEQMTDLERRVRLLEDLNLDHRLTIMETVLMEVQTGTLWERFTMGGTGLLIGERVVSAMKKKGVQPDA